MPKFAVIVRQYVEELASIVVEGTDTTAATKRVREIIKEGIYCPDWEDGFGIHDDGIEVVDIHKAPDDAPLTEVDD